MINFKKTYIMKTGIIIIDPGHGGVVNGDGSDSNHAVSALGNLEKSLFPDIGFFLNTELKFYLKQQKISNQFYLRFSNNSTQKGN